jgi:hypothetical protein
MITPRRVLVATLLFVGTLATASTTDGWHVTFTKDVAPILQKNCQTCHRPGEAAPMSLLTYEHLVDAATSRSSCSVFMGL